MKKKIILSVLVVAFLLASMFAQLGTPPSFREWYAKADRLYNLDEPTTASDSTALYLFLKTAGVAVPKDYPLAITSCIKAGNIHQGYQRFTEANRLYHHAISLNNRHVQNPAAAYEAYLYLGSSLYFSNVIDSAQHYFEAASEIALGYKGNDNLPEKERLYNSLGAIYYESANYQQAKNYFQRALEFTSPNAADYQELYTGVKSNIANCLMKLNQYDSALRIFQLLTPGDQQKDIIRQNTAHSYFELAQYDSALFIYQSLLLKNDFSGIVALTDMGRIYMSRKQWQQAEAVFDSAIARNKNISLTIKNKEEALAYLYRSQLAMEQGLLDEAITWINEALQEVHMKFTWRNMEDLPEDISHTVSPITLFNILHTKAGLLYKKYDGTKQPQLLKASLLSYRKAIETANFIKLNFDNDEAKFFFNENYQPIYNEAIQVAYEAVNMNNNHADDYLFILENYKGNILYQNLQNVLLKSVAGVTDSVRSREKEIKQLLSFYTSRLNQATAEKDAAILQKRLLALQVELSRLQKSYEKDTSYSFSKNQIAENKFSLSDIQSGLDGSTVLLNYYTNDQAVYCMVVSKKAVHLQKINIDSVFKKSVRLFIDDVYHYTEGERYEGAVPSAILYRYLIQPIEEQIKDFENWVIVPDGILYYLPFEALIKDETQRNYLMLSHTISYHYSFALLFEKNTHYKSGYVSNSSVGFAPYAHTDDNLKRSQLPELPLSKEEVAGMENHNYVGSAATKKIFLQHSTRYPIVHLATHASIGTDSSSNWIQFYPADTTAINNKLFVHEIYNLDMHQAELVVLSACQTGGGVAATGEGLLSLSRAFMYAGADGIISTLWKTEDRVTAFLMGRMHNYLKEKISPEKALQMAKIDLINDKAIGAQYKTPNYWANFIYVGKLHDKSQNSLQGKWFILCFILLATGIFFVFWNKIKSPHK
jgi:CHAT domain-containing protein/tetratricopeptide (TPR) repeat protein